MDGDVDHPNHVPDSNGTINSGVRPSSSTGSEETDIFGTSSPGVLRMEILREAMTIWDRIRIFVSLFLVAYAYGLDSTLRFIYQPHAMSGLGTHSTLATLNVLRAVIAAAAQITAAKIADVFGRLELVVVGVIFYVVGTIVEATCHNVQGFIAGAVIYQIGFTTIVLLVEVIVADITSLRSRLISIYVPNLPFLINTWVSGNISETVLRSTTWRWGIGMWAAIYTVISIPLLVSLYIPYRRAMRDPNQATRLEDQPSPLRVLGYMRLARALFRQLDILGLIGLIVIFGLILVPFTVAGGANNARGASEQWSRPVVIVPLTIGVLGTPVWLWWERKAKRHALVPFRLLRDRAVWGALGIACMLTFCWSVQADFLYTVLVVAFGESIKSATRISSLYSFSSVLTGIFVGFVVFIVRRLKLFIVFGTVLFLAAFGALIHFRGGPGRTSHSGIVGAQILLGIAGGFFPFPALTSIQAATRHEHVAIITGLYLAMYNIGSALGNSVSGAIWTQILVPTLLQNLPAPYNNTTIAEGIFASPFEYADNYTIGTPLRDAMVKSYRHIQKLLTITGICLCVPLIFCSFAIRNPILGREQSRPDAEQANSRADRNRVDRTPWFGRVLELVPMRRSN